MKVSRNEACPCGSGKKFKACCGKGEKTRTGATSGRILAAIISVVVIGGAAIAINQFRHVSGDGLPQPWEYDAARNRHWHQQPGGGHWDTGLPPNQAGGLTPTPILTPGAGGLPTLPPLEPAVAEVPGDGSPAAWDYDAENDKHWNPNTRTWDAGMPPLEAFTSGNE